MAPLPTGCAATVGGRDGCSFGQAHRPGAVGRDRPRGHGLPRGHDVRGGSRRVRDRPMGLDGGHRPNRDRARPDAGHRRDAEAGHPQRRRGRRQPTRIPAVLSVHPRDELSAVADLAVRYGVRVVVDEVHAPIVYPDASHIPYLSLPDTGSAFTVFSASKAWNLAGLKAALVIAGPRAATDLAMLP